MFNDKLMILALLCSTIRGDDTLSDEYIVDRLAEACPQVDICDKNATSAVLRPNGRLWNSIISCCKGCSCHPDCLERMNCCKEQDIVEGVGRETAPVCTQMRIGSPGQRWNVLVPAFYTIFTAPDGGCFNKTPFETISGEAMLPTCESKPVAFWGDFSPVLSKTSKKIYKNEACALCHGVNDSDPFVIYLECDRISFNRTYKYKYQMHDYIDVFEMGKMRPFCEVEFRHTYMPVLQATRCLVDMVANCTSGVKTNYKPVTDNATILACTEGFYAPLVVESLSYKNPFCAACNGARKSPTSPPVCHIDSFLWRQTSETKFTFLLDPAFGKSNRPNGVKLVESMYPEACLGEVSSKPRSSCRKVLCPTGMVRRQGACVYISKQWIASGFKINVKLSFPDMHLSEINFDPGSLVPAILQNNPWSDEWEAFQAMTKLEGGSVNDLFYIQLIGQPGGLTVKEFMDTIKYTLSEPWKAKGSGTRVLYFNQSYLEYSINDGLISDLFQPTWKTAIESTPGHPYTNVSSELWLREKKRPLSTFMRNPVSLNKMYFCEQIELRANEYDFEVDPYIIKNKIDGRLLYDEEFILMKDESGSHVVRVCLSDTSFVRVVSGCEKWSITSFVLFVSICIAILR